MSIQRRASLVAGIAVLGVSTLRAPAARAQVPVSSPALGQAFLVASGQGEAKVTPDRAAVMITVSTHAPTAAAAGADNATRTRAVLTALERLGLTKDQLTTEGYSVSPEMVYGNGVPPRVTGYAVTNTVRAETRQTSQVGAIIDAALGAGANLINGLSFYAASIDSPRREAIALAVGSARADAEAMALAAGGSLGALLEMSTQGPISPPRPMYQLSMQKGMAAPETPMNPGQQTVSAFVTARWVFVPR